jgi:hypothetical protein
MAARWRLFLVIGDAKLVGFEATDFIAEPPRLFKFQIGGGDRFHERVSIVLPNQNPLMSVARLVPVNSFP